MFKRLINKELLLSAKMFPVITITGPRQSGKTTVTQEVFKNYPYFTLEDPDTKALALSDPRSFISTFRNGVILDEIQNVPDLFSYIQGLSDKYNKPGMFILTGSQNFLLLEKISQTLAGRVDIIKLLPLHLSELKGKKYTKYSYEEFIFKGMYPRIYSQNIPPNKFYPNYLQTYVERDLRAIKNIGNLHTFQKFMMMCAARIGQLINVSSLANDVGVTSPTIEEWLSVLEASFIIYLLKPYHKNYNKRLTKMPKLYFYDTGLASYLLKIRSVQQVETHFLKGGLFENFIINELLKRQYNKGILPEFYFWRDSKGKEIDLIIDTPDKEILIEIKSGRTLTQEYFRGLKYYNKISDGSPDNAFVVYGGDQSFKLTNGTLVSWNNLKRIEI